jgi:CheY-like chemotaxis protein
MNYTDKLSHTTPEGIIFYEFLSAIEEAIDMEKVSKRLSFTLQKAKREALTSLNHEIRTPMNAIVGMTRLLEETNLNSEQKQYLVALQNSSSRLMQVVDEILELSNLISNSNTTNYHTMNPAIAPTTLNGIKILVAEDDEINQLLIRTILTKWEATVYITSTGLEAVKKLQSEDYDLVLMDMQMPEMDGIEATKVIRKKLKSKVPIMAFTANVLEGEREKCMKAGMNDFMAKPFEPKDLFRKIKELTVKA